MLGTTIVSTHVVVLHTLSDWVVVWQKRKWFTKCEKVSLMKCIPWSVTRVRKHPNLVKMHSYNNLVITTTIMVCNALASTPLGGVICHDKDVFISCVHPHWFDKSNEIQTPFHEWIWQ
jgi:hypothetical protein